MALPAVALDRAEPVVRELLSELYEQAQSASESSAARGRLAMALEINGFPPAALTVYAQAAALDDDRFVWPYFAAVELARRADYGAALRQLDAAIDIDDRYVPAHLYRGNWLLEVGDVEGALDAFEEAARLGGEPASAASGIARVYLRQDDAEAALQVLIGVVRQHDYPYLQRQLGRAYQALGRANEARIAFARGRKDLGLRWLDPRQSLKREFIVSFGARLSEAERSLKAGDVDRALAELQALRELRPNDLTLLRVLGTAYLRAGQPQRGKAAMKRGLRLDPDNYFLHFYLAGLYRETGDSGKALSHMRRAVEIVPERGRGHYLLATLEMDRGNYDAALASFDAALGHGVKDVTSALYLAGMIEVRQGRYAQARTRFARAVHLDPAFADGYTSLARTLAELGDFKRARHALKWAKAVGATPDALRGAGQHVAERDASDA